MPKPGINVTLTTSRILGKTQVCEYVPGRVNFTSCGHAPAVRGMKSIASHTR